MITYLFAIGFVIASGLAVYFWGKVPVMRANEHTPDFGFAPAVATAQQEAADREEDLMNYQELKEGLAEVFHATTAKEHNDAIERNCQMFDHKLSLFMDYFDHWPVVCDKLVYGESYVEIAKGQDLTKWQVRRMFLNDLQQFIHGEYKVDHGGAV